MDYIYSLEYFGAFIYSTKMLVTGALTGITESLNPRFIRNTAVLWLCDQHSCYKYSILFSDPKNMRAGGSAGFNSGDIKLINQKHFGRLSQVIRLRR